MTGNIMAEFMEILSRNTKYWIRTIMGNHAPFIFQYIAMILNSLFPLILPTMIRGIMVEYQQT